MPSRRAAKPLGRLPPPYPSFGNSAGAPRPLEGARQTRPRRSRRYPSLNVSLERACVRLPSPLRKRTRITEIRKMSNRPDLDGTGPMHELGRDADRILERGAIDHIETE